MSANSRRIVSRIPAFYLMAAMLPASAAQTPAADPDALYRDRANLASARQAADIWTQRAAGGTDAEAAWKLARVCYWIGTQGPERERRAALDRGVTAGEQAARLAPARPEGHFWLAANMGALAESFGMMQGLKYRGRIKDALLRVLAIDPAWQQGSADRALGWWYHKVPGLFGGSRKKAEEHLRTSLTYNPRSTMSLYFLAEVLAAGGKRAEARALLQQVLDTPPDPEWIPEDRANKAKAAARLARGSLTAPVRGH